MRTVPVGEKRFQTAADGPKGAGTGAAGAACGVADSRGSPPPGRRGWTDPSRRRSGSSGAKAMFESYVIGYESRGTIGVPLRRIQCLADPTCEKIIYSNF